MKNQLGTSPAVNVLSNLDLLNLILACVPEYAPLTSGRTLLPQDKRNLLGISLTCKVFFDAAMGRLWNTMESFLPLLCVIPCVVKTPQLITTSRIINHTDLHRLEFYTRRIRHFFLISFKERVSTHIYTALVRLNGSNTLLRALRSVRIHLNYFSNENLLCLPLIASSSSLFKVEVHHVGRLAEMHLASFIHDISSHHSSPDGISTVWLEGYITSSTLRLLEGFTQLSRLSLNLRFTDPLVDLLQTLSNLPSLDDLVLQFPGDDKDGIKLPPPVKASFQKLQTLGVTGHIIYVLHVLRSIQGECLSNVAFTVVSSKAAPDIFRACIESATTMTQHLHHLRMVFPSGDIILPDAFTVPLQKCKPQLRTLYIRSGLITRKHFQDLFKETSGKWSALESLNFDCRPNKPSFKKEIPLLWLHMIADSCPKLLSLSVSMSFPLGQSGHSTDETEVLANYFRKPMESTNQCAPSLVKLVILFIDHSFSPSDGGDILLKAITVARFIHHVYPRLRDLAIWDEAVKKTWNQWYRVVVAMVGSYREVWEAASSRMA